MHKQVLILPMCLLSLICLADWHKCYGCRCCKAHVAAKNRAGFCSFLAISSSRMFMFGGDFWNTKGKSEWSWLSLIHHIILVSWYNCIHFIQWKGYTVKVLHEVSVLLLHDWRFVLFFVKCKVLSSLVYMGLPRSSSLRKTRSQIFIGWI